MEISILYIVYCTISKYKKQTISEFENPPPAWHRELFVNIPDAPKMYPDFIDKTRKPCYAVLAWTEQKFQTSAVIGWYSPMWNAALENVIHKMGLAFSSENTCGYSCNPRLWDRSQ
jgi:hypothetical protein